MLRESAPPAPVVSTEHERAAQYTLASYRPSFLDKVLKQEPARLRRLEQAALTARLRDEQLTNQHQDEYARQYAGWKAHHELARAILSRNSDEYGRALDLFGPFESISGLDVEMAFTYTADHIEVDFHSNPISIVPNFVVSQLSGALMSRKTLTTSKINEIYKDHVCSCVLRMAREIYAHLPVSRVVVHALTDQVSPATGLTDRPIAF